MNKIQRQVEKISLMSSLFFNKIPNIKSNSIPQNTIKFATDIYNEIIKFDSINNLDNEFNLIVSPKTYENYKHFVRFICGYMACRYSWGVDFKKPLDIAKTEELQIKFFMKNPSYIHAYDMSFIKIAKWFLTFYKDIKKLNHNFDFVKIVNYYYKQALQTKYNHDFNLKSDKLFDKFIKCKLTLESLSLILNEYEKAERYLCKIEKKYDILLNTKHWNNTKYMIEALRYNIEALEKDYFFNYLKAIDSEFVYKNCLPSNIFEYKADTDGIVKDIIILHQDMFKDQIRMIQDNEDMITKYIMFDGALLNVRFEYTSWENGTKTDRVKVIVDYDTNIGRW